MIDRTIIAATADAVEALDFSAENDRIAQLEAEIGRLETAAETGLARVADIVAQVTDRNSITGTRNLNPGAVADALFASLDPAEAATVTRSVSELETQRDQLRGGVAELRIRIRDANDEIASIRLAAGARVLATVQPVMDGIMADAREAALRIVEAWAALQAIGWAARLRPNGTEPVQTAVDGLEGGGRGLWRRQDIAVPAEIVSLLAPLASKGPALRPTLARTVKR